MTVCKVKTFTHRIEPMENYHQICSSLPSVRSLTASCLWLSVLVLWPTILLFSFTLTTLISAMLWHLILSLFVTIKQICQSLCSYLLQTTFKLTFLTYLFNRSSASSTSMVFLFAWMAYVSKSSASRSKNLSILLKAVNYNEANVYSTGSEIYDVFTILQRKEISIVNSLQSINPKPLQS